MDTMISMAASMLLSSFVTYVVARRKEDQAIRKGLQALLRHNMSRSYHDYKEQGYATEEEKREFENMYVQYHELGKNGVMTAMYQSVLSMKETNRSGDGI